MNNKKSNISFVLEVFWLIVAILTGIMAVHAWITLGIRESGMFFLMCALSLFLYIARRTIRKKLNKN